MGSLFFGTGFPSSPNDFHIVTQKFLDHISTCDNIRNVPEELDTSSIDALVRMLYCAFIYLSKISIWIGDFFAINN